MIATYRTLDSGHVTLPAPPWSEAAEFRPDPRPETKPRGSLMKSPKRKRVDARIVAEIVRAELEAMRT